MKDTKGPMSEQDLPGHVLIRVRSLTGKEWRYQMPLGVQLRDVRQAWHRETGIPLSDTIFYYKTWRLQQDSMLLELLWLYERDPRRRNRLDVALFGPSFPTFARPPENHIAVVP